MVPAIQFFSTRGVQQTGQSRMTAMLFDVVDKRLVNSFVQSRLIDRIFTTPEASLLRPSFDAIQPFFFNLGALNKITMPAIPLRSNVTGITVKPTSKPTQICPYLVRQMVHYCICSQISWPWHVVVQRKEKAKDKNDKYRRRKMKN